MNNSNVLDRHLNDARRICPVLPGSARIKGSSLTMRHGRDIIRLSAPKRFLERLFDWCQGDLSLADIEAASLREFHDGEFIRFVHAMMDAHVLVDSSNLLALTAKQLHWSGRVVNPEVWTHIKRPTSAHGSATYRFGRPAPSNLQENLSKRHSANSFGPRPLNADQVAALLYAGYGMSLGCSDHRNVASAGGFYRIDFQVILLEQADDLAAGLYSIEFHQDGGTSFHLKKTCTEEVPRLVLAPHQLINAAGLVILSSDLSLSGLKYRSRAYSFGLIEAGSVVQNIALSAAEQGIGWRTIGGFEEEQVAKYCGLPPDHNVLVCGLFGSQASPSSSQRTLAEFSWAPPDPNLPFHVGMARIASSRDASATYSWGRDRVAATAYDKAVAEATERYAYHLYRPEKNRIARYGDFPGMLHPDKFLGYLPSQYRAKFFYLNRFDGAKRYAWTEASSLSTGTHHWILSDLVYDKDTIERPDGGGAIAMATSSGCASGFSPSHAREKALFELTERDAFMRHWFAQQGGYKIAFQTLPREYQLRIEALTKRGCTVHIQLLHLGAEPAWLCIIQHESKHFTVVGSGAGVNSAEALSSALAEAETGAYSRIDTPYRGRIKPVEVGLPQDHADLYASRRYFRRADPLMRASGEISFAEGKVQCSASFDTLLAKLATKGIDPIWVDLTLPAPPLTLAGNTLHSCRILASGLIPMTFGSSRLPLALDTYRVKTARFPHPFP
ncbi:hypothetical protein G5S34_20055 [Herbaspirillum frisingense]|uniref:YcaO-like family protein n=1 Tax=Herbaspirillum frisingense TaxID=92645 RepID=UPI0015FF5299|nr:YcaO-like family protein [Herbaspirillum frisingense]QNB08821.1 hypothetical protein G5S34_20055 [Herbaspirillum frisingense]